MLMTTIEPYGKSQLYTQEFRGLNRTERAGDGELAEMLNMRSDLYPVLSPRRNREVLYSEQGLVYSILDKPGMGLFWVREGRGLGNIELVHDGVPVDAVNALLEETARIPQLVSMGADILIFPQGVWYKPITNEAGLIREAFSATLSEARKVEIRYCDHTGEIITGTSGGVKPPKAPNDGDYWVDRSDPKSIAAKVWSDSSQAWLPVTDFYTKILYPGIGAGFLDGDAVRFGGRLAESFDGDITIYKRESDDAIIVQNIWPHSGTMAVGEISIERDLPEMDYVVECNNRLWGCYYGNALDGSALNEIYACALGDYRNWRRYSGDSMASYTASRGSDGAWTGAITYQGKPHFFKANSCDVVYPSSTGAHEIVTSQLRGPGRQQAMRGSMAIVDEILYYYTGSEVIAYDGSSPATVSGALGDISADAAVGWGVGHKYYLYLMREEHGSELLVLDCSKGLWYREDQLEIWCMGGDGRRLLLCAENGEILLADAGQCESAMKWMIETGDMGLDAPGRKYISRFEIRLKLERGSSCDLYIQYDSSGEWEHKGHIVCGPWLQSRPVPVIPRRCDHLRFRIEGKGDCKLYSIARQYEEGSDRL